MRVLAIDIGTANLGWAIGGAGLQKPVNAVYHPPAVRRNIGWLLADVRAWLTTTCRTYAVTNIVYCSPVFVPNNNPWTIRKINSIAGHIGLFCYDHEEIAVEEGDEPRIRKHFLAPHKVPRKSAEIKEAVMARCRQMGWAPEMDDDADALALLDYTLALKGSRLALITAAVQERLF